MKLKKTLLAICVLVFLSSVVSADSPLTSTDFSEAYSEEPIIIAASKTDGEITNELMDYMTDDNKPIDVKMAVINKLGWNIDGKTNSQIFMKYLKDKFGYKDEKKLLEKGKADVLLSMAYLKALDNYSKVDDAIKYADAALKENKKSRTFHLIAALIKAQKAFDDSWCEVYQITDHVRKNEDLKDDIKPEAVQIIYEYMNIYGDSCK